MESKTFIGNLLMMIGGLTFACAGGCALFFTFTMGPIMPLAIAAIPMLVGWALYQVGKGLHAAGTRGDSPVNKMLAQLEREEAEDNQSENHGP